MVLPDKGSFPLNRFFRDLREKVREVCPFLKITCRSYTKKGFLLVVPRTRFYIITKWKEYYPHTLLG